MDFRMMAGTIGCLLAAHAVAAQPTVEECVATKDDAARLACYDSLHGRSVAPATPPATAALPAVGTASAARAAPAVASDPLTARWDLDGTDRGFIVPRPYRPLYVLAGDWTNNINRQPGSPSPDHSVGTPLVLRPIEVKYQISFKSKLMELPWDVSAWAAYTQSSRWQLYNPADSRPFRETNYEPEFMLVKPLDVRLPLVGGTVRMVSLAYNHQSNGRALPLSRSWNRIIGSLVYEKGPWTAEVRPWVRLQEDAADDDNPDISDYAGRGELRLTRRFGSHFVSLLLRHSLRSGSRSHGAAQLDYVFPVPRYPALHGMVQVFTGYAESMIDYNVRQTRVGIGLTIGDWQ
jgi:phospholipase A1